MLDEPADSDEVRARKLAETYRASRSLEVALMVKITATDPGGRRSKWLVGSQPGGRLGHLSSSGDERLGSSRRYSGLVSTSRKSSIASGDASAKLGPRLGSSPVSVCT